MLVAFVSPVRGLLVCAAVALLAGCASPANPVNMTMRAAEATDLRLRTPDWSKSAVLVKEVSGGRETNPAWTSQVSSADFRTALEDSLRSVGMLAAPARSRYEVVAHLAKVEQPMFGASMTVTVTVNYQLIDVATRKTVFERSMTSAYTAAWNDAFSGIERLKLANEGAVRTSVTDFIKLLQGLSTGDVTVR